MSTPGHTSAYDTRAKVGTPVCQADGVGAREVVGAAREGIDGGADRGRVRPHQAEAEDVVGLGQGDVGSGGGEGEPVAGAAGHVVDPCLGLAHVGLEPEGKRRQGVENGGRGGSLGRFGGSWPREPPGHSRGKDQEDE